MCLCIYLFVCLCFSEGKVFSIFIRSKTIHEPKKMKIHDAGGKIGPFILKPALAISTDTYNASFPGCHCTSCFLWSHYMSYLTSFLSQRLTVRSFFLTCDLSLEELDRASCQMILKKNNKSILRYWSHP